MPTYSQSAPIADDPTGAILLNGSSDYVSKAVSGFRSTDTKGSITAWVNTSGAAADYVILSAADTATASYALFFQVDGANGNIAIGTTIAGTINEVRGGTTVNDGNWHYVCVTSDGAAWKLYVDAVEETLTATTGSNDGSWFGDLTGADNLVIGALVQSSTSGYFSGSLDEVSVFDYPLSAAQILDQYSAAALGNNTASVPALSVTVSSTAPSITSNENRLSVPAASVSVTTTAPQTISFDHDFISAPSVTLTPTTTAPAPTTTDAGRTKVPRVQLFIQISQPLANTGDSHRSSVTPASLTVRTYAPVALTPPIDLTPGGDTCISVQVLLAGTDVTSYISGEILVEEEENSSAIASFQLLGTPALTYPEGAEVRVLVDSRVLFTGLVSSYAPDVDRGLVEVECTNDLQGWVRQAVKDAGGIDEFDLPNGARWNSDLFSAQGDEWDQFQQAMELAPYDAHLDRTRQGLVYAHWHQGDAVDITNATRLHGSLRGTLGERSSIVNQINIKVQNSYPVTRSASVLFQWSAISGTGAWDVDSDWELPSDEDFVSAINTTGFNASTRSCLFERPWEWKGDRQADAYESYRESFDESPRSGYQRMWATNKYGYREFAIEVPENKIIKAVGVGSKSWEQQIIDNYEITVKCQESIDSHGLLDVDESYSIQHDENVFQTESSNSLDEDDNILSDSTEIAVGDAGRHIRLMRAAVARAKTEILSSHRTHEESFQVLFDHQYSLEKRVNLSGVLSCSGKISALRHSIDPTAGSALTELTIIVSGFDGQLYNGDDEALDVSSTGGLPTGAISGVQIQTSAFGAYTSNAVFYPSSGSGASRDGYSGFNIPITRPQVDQSLVDDHESTITQEVAVSVPVDSYSIDWSALSCE